MSATMTSFASYEYCQEAPEEARRVETVRRFCLPERWWGQRAEHHVLRKDPHVYHWRLVKREICRTNRTFPLPDRPGRVRLQTPQFSNPETREDRVEDTIELLKLYPEQGIALRYLAALRGDDEALSIVEEALAYLHA